MCCRIPVVHKRIFYLLKVNAASTVLRPEPRVCIINRSGHFAHVRFFFLLHFQRVAERVRVLHFVQNIFWQMVLMIVRASFQWIVLILFHISFNELYQKIAPETPNFESGW